MTLCEDGSPMLAPTDEGGCPTPSSSVVDELFGGPDAAEVAEAEADGPIARGSDPAPALAPPLGQHAATLAQQEADEPSETAPDGVSSRVSGDTEGGSPKGFSFVEASVPSDELFGGMSLVSDAQAEGQGIASDDEAVSAC